MVKNVAFLSATVAMLMLSGCSSKAPAIDATANQGTTAQGSSAASSATTGTDTSAVIAPVTTAPAQDSTASASNGSDTLVSVLFDFDKFDIRADMEAPMKDNASLVKNKTVKLEGNCDEFGSDEYNYALGLKRANSVKSALINAGMNADSITMVSLGEGNPVCLEKTKECWAKNRRVDFKLP